MCNVSFKPNQLEKIYHINLKYIDILGGGGRESPKKLLKHKQIIKNQVL